MDSSLEGINIGLSLGRPSTVSLLLVISRFTLEITNNRPPVDGPHKLKPMLMPSRLESNRNPARKPEIRPGGPRSGPEATKQSPMFVDNDLKLKNTDGSEGCFEKYHLRGEQSCTHY